MGDGRADGLGLGLWVDGSGEFFPGRRATMVPLKMHRQVHGTFDLTPLIDETVANPTISSAVASMQAVSAQCQRLIQLLLLRPTKNSSGVLNFPREDLHGLFPA